MTKTTANPTNWPPITRILSVPAPGPTLDDCKRALLSYRYQVYDADNRIITQGSLFELPSVDNSSPALQMTEMGASYEAELATLQGKIKTLKQELATAQLSDKPRRYIIMDCPECGFKAPCE